MGKPIDAESSLVAVRGWAEGKEGDCLLYMGFSFGVMKAF